MKALGPDGEAAMALIAARALRRNQDRAARLTELLVLIGFAVGSIALASLTLRRRTA